MSSPCATTSRSTAFTAVPAQASRHAVMMSTCDTSKATPPTIQYVRAPTANITAVATTRPPASSHSRPHSREIGCVSCGSSA